MSSHPNVPELLKHLNTAWKDQRLSVVISSPLAQTNDREHTNHRTDANASLPVDDKTFTIARI